MYQILDSQFVKLSDCNTVLSNRKNDDELIEH